MNTRYSAYPSYELSPFCANDKVFANPDCVWQNNDLPGHQELIGTINQHEQVDDWPLSLLIVGLGPFTAGHFEISERIRHIGSLGVAAKLQHCVRNYNKFAFVKNDMDSDIRIDLTTQHTGTMAVSHSRNRIHGQATLYSLTNSQFAILTTAADTMLAHLRENLLTTLKQPLFIGQQTVTTSIAIGTASGSQYTGRAESFVLAARSALYLAGKK